MTAKPLRRTKFRPTTMPVDPGYDIGACRCSTITNPLGQKVLHRRQQCIEDRAAKTVADGGA